MNESLKKYYAERANEYDLIYRKPERQVELRVLARKLSNLLNKRNVIEVACGTGYWTQFIAERCIHVTATDCNHEVLEIAERRLEEYGNISCKISDAFELNGIAQEYDGAFAGFWLSHLKKDQISCFLEVLHSKLIPGSIIVFVDNRYVEGSSTPISRRDEGGNTYQLRQLDNGSKREILKNFITKQDFTEVISNHSNSVGFVDYKYYWCGWYVLSEE
ncbi:SAM-dependent methyltransferase [Candidatus Fermentibacteria bacterium]|nr:MAG: SAM-dependent methyltransferase [Candidatus Fermentibacteria bacterium]PIE52302.1 MAG: SAM-dependent methyltransferase [Candidatus Fermentibacteria bacterium]PIE52797.1 MAG: SAM-dependent methyltransferase [Candidatus Fermentibacteria bacterium]